MAEFDPKKHQNIEKLEKNLYSQDFENNVSPRSTFSDRDTDIKKQWQPQHGLDSVLPNFEPPKMSLFKKILIGSIVFFLACAAIAVFAFYRGLNVVSADKVDISFIGPVSIAAGNELDVDVVVDNKNNIPLKDATLYIDYPDGTKQAADLTQDLLHDKVVLGDIAVGGNIHHTLKMVLFGAAQSTKDIEVKLEYTIQNSNDPFTKTKPYEVLLTSSPLSMTIDNPPEIASNQDLSFTIHVISNSSTPLNNLLLQAGYPFGFEYLSATPTPMTNNTSLFAIPVLNPGETKTFTIQGRIEGEEGDERVFKFSVGATSADQNAAITTNYLTQAQSVAVHKPPLGLDLTINDSSNKDPTISPGQPIQGVIKIVNNLPQQVLDGKASVVFSGNSLDPATPQGDTALYRAPVKTLSWDKTSLPQLGLLNPGDTLSLPFSFSSLPPGTLARIKNGTIVLSLEITGRTIASTGTNSDISLSLDRTLKIQPTISVIPRIVYSVGVFKNSGPVPPKAETKTTYTVIWTVTSSSDEMDNLDVEGLLPSYVRWMGVTSPQSEKITWNSQTNKVVWHVDSIPAGQAGAPAREVQFQVEVNPSTSQINSSPTVVDAIHFQATDGFTQNIVSDDLAPLTTSLSTDPKFQGQSGLVVK